MPKKLLFSLSLVFAVHSVNAQIFTWKNPNISADSAKRDSVLSAKIEKDFYTRDTLDFIRTQNKVIVDEGILIKPSRSGVLGDLNSKGSILRATPPDTSIVVRLSLPNAV